jgi:superfamily II DNA helicase RecQ
MNVTVYLLGVTTYGLCVMLCVLTESSPAYRAFKHLRSAFSDVPVIALTATATPRVIEDIQNCLKMQNVHVVRSSIDRFVVLFVIELTFRPNLFLSASVKGNNPSTELLPFLRASVRDPMKKVCFFVTASYMCRSSRGPR